jgi:signal transduction histidine kinase
VVQAVAEYLKACVHRRTELIPLGFSWMFGVFIDVTSVLIVMVATVQRPATDLRMCLLAVVIACAPEIVLFFSGLMFKASLLWVAWMTSASIFLFGTSTPVESDFAPLLLVLMVGTAVALGPVLMGAVASFSAAGLLVFAAQTHHLTNLALYLPVLGIGAIIGLLMHAQQQLIISLQETRAALADHAVADERRRIAREVHDVIAHSLSITLLHLTGARRELQEGGDSAEVVDSLQQAEQLGRQAMADIRRTVGLLDGGPMSTAPEPGVDDITALVDDFRRAGLNVMLRTSGAAATVSAAVGLALYRITQESLANVAKHAPDSKCTVQLDISKRSADLSVTNLLPVRAAAQPSAGRGIAGMRQRVEILDGDIQVSSADDEWSVRASVPLGESGSPRPPWCRG